MAANFASFSEFWPHYLRQHSLPRTRALHYAGTLLVVAVIVLALATSHWPWLLALPVAGYLFAWIGHFVIERNRPATFSHPFWSLAADFLMTWCWLTGRLDRELERAGVS